MIQWHDLQFPLFFLSFLAFLSSEICLSQTLEWMIYNSLVTFQTREWEMNNINLLCHDGNKGFTYLLTYFCARLTNKEQIDHIYCHCEWTSLQNNEHTWDNQALTNEPGSCDQMALGVFPNCHECKKTRFSGFEIKLRLFTSWPKTHGVLEIPITSSASGCITPCSLLL